MDYMYNAAKRGALQGGLNYLIPGGGSVVNAYEAYNNIRKGNYSSAAVNTLSGCFNFATSGLFGGGVTAVKRGLEGFGRAVATGATSQTFGCVAEKTTEDFVETADEGYVKFILPKVVGAGVAKVTVVVIGSPSTAKTEKKGR